MITEVIGISGFYSAELKKNGGESSLLITELNGKQVYRRFDNTLEYCQTKSDEIYAEQKNKSGGIKL